MHKFNVICICESYLNPKTLSINDNLNIPGYIICTVMIIILEIDVGEFAFIIKSLCLLKCLITFRDVFVLI